MKAAQAAIKVFALCLAGLIMLSIVAAAVGAFALVGVIVDGSENGVGGEAETVWQGGAETAHKIKGLEISVGATRVQLIDSDKDQDVRVETNNDYVTSWEDGGVLKVVEKSHMSITQLWSSKEVLIYVPEGMKFDTVEIVTGAGTLSAERIVAKRAKLKLGAGKASIGVLEASERVEVDGGAGVTEIRQGRLNNLDFDLGAGKSTVRARVTGDSKINSGVGKLDLDLIGEESDYKIMIDKGIGSVKVNGLKQQDESVYGAGENLIRLSSGVGAVDINVMAE